MPVVELDSIHARFLTDLRNFQLGDGGFGYTVGGGPETEPSAVATLALGDRRVARALAAYGRPSGAPMRALAALALGDAGLLATAIEARARTIGESGAGPTDGREGWGWTRGTYSWVEPTSWILLATKKLRPEDTGVVAEAEGLLAERQCDDGGWNYGNASTEGVDLRGYVQTTAVALIALQGRPAALARPGAAFLHDRWRQEVGGLSVAQAIVATRLSGDAPGAADGMVAALVEAYDRTAFLGNVLALAWAALATAPAEHLAGALGAG